METLTLPDTASTSTEPTAEEPELNLLLPSAAEEAWRPGNSAVVRSLLAHIFVIGGMLLVRVGPAHPPPPEEYFVKHVTPLYTPPDLTQKAPNKGPVKKDMTLETIAPHPAVKAPSPAPSQKQIASAKPATLPPTPTPPAPKPIAAIEPPKIEAPPPQAVQAPQIATNLAQLPPPPVSGAPKITMEDVGRQAPAGKPTGLIPVPSSSVDEALKAVTRGGSSGAGAGGEVTMDQIGSGPGLNLPPSVGRPNAGISLVSNPQGVDFKPYLIQVMAAIRRNWFAVYPEAAKTGMRGEVTLQFRVAKNGLVAKVVYSGQTNSKALNEATVSAISASNPFPPLPVEFKGDHIDLQMRFLYNVQR